MAIAHSSARVAEENEAMKPYRAFQAWSLCVIRPDQSLATRSYCWAITRRISASVSLISSPLTSMTTLWSVPVNSNGGS